MSQMQFIRNHFEVDTRPEVISKNRSYRKGRADPSERFQNKIEFENYDLFWMGNVPEMNTPKGRISFINDLQFFQKEIAELEVDQQGSIEYDARRTNIKYHCRVRFSVSKKTEDAVYLFFYDPVINTIS